MLELHPKDTLKRGDDSTTGTEGPLGVLVHKGRWIQSLVELCYFTDDVWTVKPTNEGHAFTLCVNSFSSALRSSLMHNIASPSHAYQKCGERPTNQPYVTHHRSTNDFAKYQNSPFRPPISVSHFELPVISR